MNNRLDASSIMAQNVENKMRLNGRFDAKDMHSYLIEKVRKFEEKLKDNEELGVKLANYGVAETIHIRSIHYRNPNMIEFTGLDQDKNNVCLVQHISQLNLLLTALRALDNKPYRIGFVASDNKD